MGECFIIRKGGSLRVPVLDKSFPKSGSSTYTHGKTTTYTFKVEIAIKGMPATYTYQWYINDKAINGATSATYTYTTKYEDSTNGVKAYCMVTNAAGSVKSNVATLTVVNNTTYIFNGSATNSLITGWELYIEKVSSSYSAKGSWSITNKQLVLDVDPASVKDKAVECSLYTKNSIDVSKFTKLHIVWGNCSISSSGSTSIGYDSFYKILNNNYELVGQTYTAPQSGTTTTIDLTKISNKDNFQLKFSGYVSGWRENGDITLRIKHIYLE